MEDERSLPPPNREETPPASGRDEEEEGMVMEVDPVGAGRWVDDPLLGSWLGGETCPGVDRPPGEEGVPPVDDCWLPMVDDCQLILKPWLVGNLEDLGLSLSRGFDRDDRVVILNSNDKAGLVSRKKSFKNPTFSLGAFNPIPRKHPLKVEFRCSSLSL